MMNIPRKKFYAALVLAVILALPLLQMPKAYLAELTVQDKALSVMTDVIGFDMTKYNAQQTGYFVEYPSDLGGLAQEEVKYILESARSKIKVYCVFINKTLTYFVLDPIEGSPLYAQPSTNVLDTAKGLLHRYQTFSKASYLQPMRDILNTVTELKPMITTVGNVKFQVADREIFDSITWMYTYNGIDFIMKKVGVSFKNGALYSFSDNWNLYKVGSTDVNISEEEAIRIARKRAKDYMVNVWPGPDVELDLVEEPLITRLTGSRGREPLTLYPFWFVELYFNKVYNNSYAIQVGIWADTGEIEYCHATGFMGGPPVEESPTTPPTEPPPDNSTGLDPTPILVAVPIVLAMILGAAFYRKRKH
ncbi:MAG: hypothetical protein ACPLRY_03665 [Candidatus Bathyarchaeales archaeon]